MNTNRRTALSALLAGTRQWDGRCLYGAALLCYFALLLVGTHVLGTYQNAWHRLGVPALAYSFGDMRNITSSIDCGKLGYDPLVHDPCDPWQRPLNYPRLWLTLLSPLHVHQTDTLVLGVGLAVLFYFSVLLYMGPVRAYEGCLYAALICSPAAMMAVERGNNDLLIFVLLSLALWEFRQHESLRFLPYALIGLCSVLKLFPFCAFFVAFREKPRIAAAVLLGSGLLFLVYLFLIRQDLQAINAALPRPTDFSYGSHVLFDRLRSAHPPVSPQILSFLAPLAVCGILGGAYLASRRFPRPHFPPQSADGLAVAAMLYAITFAFGHNYNYRLITLIFAVPALLGLFRDSIPYRRFAASLLAIMVTAFWLAPFHRTFFLKEAADWLLFAGLTFCLLQILPEWLQVRIGLSPRNDRESSRLLPSPVT